MKRFNRISIELANVNKQIDALYKQKKQLEKDLDIEYDNVKERCQRGGKTIDNLEEWD